MTQSYVVRTVLQCYDYLTPEQVIGRLRHSSFVNFPKRFMYYAVPKAACTSMKTLLHDMEGGPPIKTICGGLDESRREMFIHARENVPLPSLVDLDDAVQQEVLEAPDFLRMTIVRNPYTRVLSDWRKVMLCDPGSEPQYIAIKGQIPALGEKDLITLAEFIGYLETEDLRTCNAHWAIQHGYAFIDALNYNLIGKVEDMPNVLEQFGRHLGQAGGIAVERKNVSEASLSGGYDSSLAKRVHALYTEDFLRFGYADNAWPSGERTAPPLVSEQRFCDELIERNLLLSALYKEVYQLRAEMERANRLHIPKVIDALVRTRDALRRSAG
jgi:hypothetical protein